MNDLTKLDPRFKPIAELIIAKFLEVTTVHLAVICTIRTPTEQEAALAAGTSWTTKSLHLPQPPNQLSLAIDLCPVPYLVKKLWNPQGSFWWTLADMVINFNFFFPGQLPVGYRLTTGMDWSHVGLPPVGQVRPKWDPGHIQLDLPVNTGFMGPLIPGSKLSVNG